MKILLLDIETAPNRAYVWGLFDQNIAINQLEASSYILCWSAQWEGQKEIMYQAHPDGELPMLAQIHAMLDEADVVVHYNGTKFDIPTLNKEFLKHGFAPPAPYKQVDLYQVARRAFRFESNKMDYISNALEIGKKMKHEGFDLWVRCMRNDPKAWAIMRRYNMQDVRLLGKLYARLRPWIIRHPNMAAMREDLSCPKCGSGKVQSRGEQIAQTRRYTRYQCQDCGGWFRGNKSVSHNKREIGVNIL